MGFYRSAPPWIQRYAQLLLCCPETQCHFRNTPHSTNRIALQEALETAKASKLDFPPLGPQRSIPLSCGINFPGLSSSIMGVHVSLDEKNYIIAPFFGGRTSRLLSFWYHVPITGDLNLCWIDTYLVMSSVIQNRISRCG